MQHLIATARNLSIVIQEKDENTITPESTIILEPLIEMVLTTYERQMEFFNGTMVNIKKTHSHRIGLNINSAQTLVTHLEEWIKEAQTLEAKIRESDLKCDLKND